MNEPLEPGELPFRDRIRVGSSHEVKAMEQISAAGWECSRIGQAMLTEPMRVLLRRKESLFRRMPDLLAARRRAGRREELLLVDPKSTMGESHLWDDYTLEKAAHAANIQWTTSFYPVVYLWADFRVNYAWDLRPTKSGMQRKGRTPFWRVPKREARSFEDIFGPAEIRTWPHPPQLQGACARCAYDGQRCGPCANGALPMQRCEWCGYYGRGFGSKLCGICIEMAGDYGLPP